MQSPSSGWWLPIELLGSIILPPWPICLIGGTCTRFCRFRRIPTRVPLQCGWQLLSACQSCFYVLLVAQSPLHNTAHAEAYVCNDLFMANLQTLSLSLSLVAGVLCRYFTVFKLAFSLFLFDSLWHLRLGGKPLVRGLCCPSFSSGSPVRTLRTSHVNSCLRLSCDVNLLCASSYVCFVINATSPHPL